MLTIASKHSGRTACDGISRRDFLKVGSLGVGGLTLADMLRLNAHGQESRGVPKSVIMVVLPGGPSHIDTYDLKPAAPAEYRGEFRPIKTTVPGIDVCELMPMQAKVADRLAVVRTFQVAGDLQHTLHEVYTGFAGEPNQAFPGGRAVRPAFGSVVSRVGPRRGLFPAYVSLRDAYTSRAVGVAEDPVYLGPAHRPFVPSGPAMRDLGPPR